ncbi:MAG TPA: L-seryl-tRNA(Sec) selenium transferase, partial [Tepidisphaeraceae bacterium]|nr:L-seryl-tRNA(Sec) selenium transferase [Tepidisphaeraceae bacterium]
LRKARGTPGEDPVARVRRAIQDLHRSRMQLVINGTGIVIHTNLGRSPLGPEVIRTICDVASNYNNLEFDLTTGDRGGRAAYLEHNLAVLSGAESATVVNNCAAALVLLLRHFTSGERKQVIISRGELVQIGGGFRIPDILQASGAVLREVGTTNKTSLADYSRAIGKQTAMILKVHRSNFFMGGFVQTPETKELTLLARKKKVPIVEDLGSGAVFSTEQIPGLNHEPTPAQIIGDGVDLVCFSGDKLLGGPQAGIIAGSGKRVRAIKREPFFRALRCDKLILSALQTTVDLHLRRLEGNSGAASEIPILAMLGESTNSLSERGNTIVSQLADLPLRAELGPGNSQVGGGTMPQSAVGSVTIDLRPSGLSLADFAARLRRTTPPVIGFISGGRFKLDLRTIFPRQDAQLVSAIRSLFAPEAASR